MDSAEVAQAKAQLGCEAACTLSKEAAVWALHFPGEYGIRLLLVSVLLSVT